VPETGLQVRRCGNRAPRWACIARRWLAVGALLLATGLPPFADAGTTVHKCVANGRTTYQSDPCPSGTDRKMPTVEELNAERRKRLQQAGGTPAPVPRPDTAVAPYSGRSASPSASRQDRGAPLVIPSAAAPAPGPFACDGRVYCSQMRSCAEAKFFLARCPGTRMDGDHDGIPCEAQWCH